MAIDINKIPGPMRIAIVVSVLWFLFWFLWGSSEGAISEGLIFGLLPLIAGWGILWIIKGFKKEKEVI